MKGAVVVPPSLRAQASIFPGLTEALNDCARREDSVLVQARFAEVDAAHPERNLRTGPESIRRRISFQRVECQEPPHGILPRNPHNDAPYAEPLSRKKLPSFAPRKAQNF